MATTEAELKTLMVAGPTGDSAAHRDLLRAAEPPAAGLLQEQARARQARRNRGGGSGARGMAAIHVQRHTYDPDQPLTPWVPAIARYGA